MRPTTRIRKRMSLNPQTIRLQHRLADCASSSYRGCNLKEPDTGNLYVRFGEG